MHSRLAGRHGSGSSPVGGDTLTVSASRRSGRRGAQPSPRGRGASVSIAKHRLVITRVIPAMLWGTLQIRFTETPPTAGHRMVGGEHTGEIDRRDQDSVANGSSPRGRGTQVRRERTLLHTGHPLAGRGTHATITVDRLLFGCGSSPRGRGTHPDIEYGRRLSFNGSSPRGRGTQD